MQIMQQFPNSTFPFYVSPAPGQPDSIQLGGVYDLRHIRFPGDIHNYVVVIDVTQTSFTFLTKDPHFDPNALITFTIYEKGGTTFLKQSGYAPTTSYLTSVVAPIGAQDLVWPMQASRLADLLAPTQPLPPLPKAPWGWGF